MNPRLKLFYSLLIYIVDGGPSFVITIKSLACCSIEYIYSFFYNNYFLSENEKSTFFCYKPRSTKL